MSAPMATCPRDGAPLIATLAFSGAEFYCLDCGAQLGFLDPVPAMPTPELNARYEQLRAEFDEHAGGRKLLVDGGWYRDCPDCDRDRPHAQHATPEERAAHDGALAWLQERVTDHPGSRR